MRSSSSFHCAAGLSLLALASFLAAPSAQAQGLALGSQGNGIGSATISGSGTSVSGDATFSGGAGPTTTSYSAVSAVSSAFGGNPSTVTLQAGGSIASLTTRGSTLTMSGGSVGNLTLAASTGPGSGQVNPSSASITGGSVKAITASGGTTAFPGQPPTSVFTTCTIQGGTFGTLASTNNGGFNIIGSNLFLFTNGLVTGTLSDGEMLNAQYTNSSTFGVSGFLDFNGIAAVPVAPPAAVPEASTTVSLGLLLMLGLGGIAVARHRKAAA